MNRIEATLRGVDRYQQRHPLVGVPFGPRSILQPPLTGPDQRALVDLAKQEERRPEQSIEVSFHEQDDRAQSERSRNLGRERRGPVTEPTRAASGGGPGSRA